MNDVSRPIPNSQYTPWWASIFFWLLIVAHLIPLFQSQYFLTVDGPAHVYNAYIIKWLMLGNAGAHADMLHFTPGLNPNWITHGIMLAFSYIFQPSTTEKLLLALYVILFCHSFRKLCRHIEGRAWYAAFLIFPLVWNITLMWGFYNFVFSIIIFFYTISYWLDVYYRLRPPRVFKLALWVTLLYFAHPVPFVLAVPLLAFITIGYSFREGIFEWEAFLKRAGALILAFLPAVLFLFLYMGDKDPNTVPNTRTIWENWEAIYKGQFIGYLGPKDLAHLQAFIRFLMWAFGLSLLNALLSRRRQKDVFLLFFILVFILAFLTPDAMAGGSILVLRIVLFSHFALFLWLASRKYPGFIQFILFAFILYYAVDGLQYRIRAFKGIASGATEFMSVSPHLQQGKTILPIMPKNVNIMPDGTQTDQWMGFFSHASGYLAAENKLMSLDNYEANAGYFPLKWNEGYDPYMELTNQPGYPSAATIAAYEEKTGQNIDYLWLWANPADTANGILKIKEEMEIRYKQVFTSPQGYGQLLKRIE